MLGERDIMMRITKRDVQELRKRLTKKGCTFDRVTGFYINSGREVVLRFSESFANLPEEEFFKYLEIAKKVFSGTPGKNLLELSFSDTDEGRAQQEFLRTLRSDKDCTDELIDHFYDLIMEHYHAEGSYLALLFHDIYDVPVRTKDRQKLDDSEEVYEYIVCALCPVDLSKPALGYREEENRIGARERDWVVGMPEVGFVYPAFIDRGADVNAVMYYAKSDSHPELIEGLLACGACRTAAEEKLMFEDVINDAFGDMQEQAENTYLFIQRNLDGLVAIREDTEEGSGDFALTAEDVADVIADIEMPDLVRESIIEGCAEMFGGDLPSASHLVDAKLAAEGERRAQILTLQRKITALEEQLDEARGLTTADAEPAEPLENSAEGAAAAPRKKLELRLPGARRESVRAAVIDGKRCLVIPMEDGETASVNGDTLPLWEEDAQADDTPAETAMESEAAAAPAETAMEPEAVAAPAKAAMEPETVAAPAETAVEPEEVAASGETAAVEDAAALTEAADVPQAD